MIQGRMPQLRLCAERLRWLTAPRMLLALTLAAYLFTAALYARWVPPLSGYDGIAHFNYVNYLRKERRLPRVDGDALQFSHELVQQPPLYYLAAALATIGVPYDDADIYARASDNPYYARGARSWAITLPNAPPAYLAALERARLVSMLGGLLAVLGAWLWVDSLQPGNRWLATATACLVAFNPAFLYLATIVTNDVWAVAGASISMWLITAAAGRRVFSLRRWFLVGCVVGLAALTKYSVLIVAVPGLMLLVFRYRNRGWRQIGLACAMLLAGSLATAGFWYIRNLVAYGELVPMEQAARVITTLRLPVPLSLAEIGAKLPWLFFSYWGVFGNVTAPSGLLDGWKWFVGIGCAGLALHLIRARDASSWEIVAVCLTWFTLALLSLLNWMRTIAFGDQARLLLVAAPAIALLLVLGWNAWLPRRWHSAANAALAGALVLVALWPLATLADAFAPPPSLAGADKPSHVVNARLANGIEVLGYDLPGGRTLWPGGQLPLRIYFSTDQAIAEHYTLFIQLVGEDNTLWYQFDGVPYGGRHPTRQWKPGQRFADTYALTTRETGRSEILATLEMGFYPIDRPDERVAVLDGAGREIDDRLTLAKVRILSEAPAVGPSGQRLLAAWEDRIGLADAAVDLDSQSNALAVKLTWQALAALPADYTVFLQMLDADNRVVGQIDQPPRKGRAPTSTWLAGEVITDTLQLAIPDRSWRRMIVGLYDGATGLRLRLSNPSAGGDYYVLQAQ